MQKIRGGVVKNDTLLSHRAVEMNDEPPASKGNAGQMRRFTVSGRKGS